MVGGVNVVGAAEAVARYVADGDGGEPGHPVVLEAELLGPLRDVSGDRGARSLLRRIGTRGVPCDDLGGGEDVNTPDELGKVRKVL